MKVVICGAGQVGMNIARYLAVASNDVTVIDQSEELLQKLGNALDIQTITGQAALPSTLERAGAEDADLLIAVTYSDEVNMIACQVAHTLFNVPTKIARVRQQDYLQARFQDLFGRTHLPIDVVISPEREVARAIALRLAVPGALNVVRFADDRVRLVVVRANPDCPVLDTPLRQLTFLFPDLHLVVVGLGRGDHFFIPDADDMILAGDEVHFIVETSQLGRVLPVFGHEERIGERVVIAGGGNVGLFLAQELEQRFPEMSLKVLEASQARAEVLADQLKRAMVLKGDARDREILEEANIASCEAIVTVTNNDEVNIMTALLAKRLGCGRALALVNHGAYNLVLRSTGVDVAINPRDTTVSSILQHVRRGRIKQAHTIRDGEAELFEAEALETSPIVGRALKDLRVAGGLIVGAIIRDQKMIMPRAETVVQAHDRVVVVTRGNMLRKAEQLFAVRLDYF